MMHNKNRPLLSAIAAMAENRTIGFKNSLPWHLPADLKHFKTLTHEHPILMGRKTFESIGKPLPNRTNIILTRDPTYQAAGCIVVTSLELAIQEALNSHHNTNNEIFIIGGEEIYRQLLPHVQQLYLTIVHHEFEGDAFFPALNNNEWHEISRETHHADEHHAYNYSFLTLERVKI